MTNRIVRTLWLWVVPAIAAAAVTAPLTAVLAGSLAGIRSTRDGVFTPAQAERGLAAYERSCARCHGADLGGHEDAEVPALADDAFRTQWHDEPASRLFERMRRMPADTPGSLAPRDYTDLLAYVLQANGAPPGADELPGDTDRLADIILALTGR